MIRYMIGLWWRRKNGPVNAQEWHYGVHVEFADWWEKNPLNPARYIGSYKKCNVCGKRFKPCDTMGCLPF